MSDDAVAPAKIGFVLVSHADAPLPSTRISVLNMLPLLRARGLDPHIVYHPPGVRDQPDLTGLASRMAEQGFDIVVFQKVRGPAVQACARELAARGIRTVFMVCDMVDEAMVDATDVTVAVTPYLKSLYPAWAQPRIHVVHDGIENPGARKTRWADHRGSRAKPLRAVLVTSFHLNALPVLRRLPNWLRVDIVGHYASPDRPLQRCREMRWSLMSQPPEERLRYLRFLLDPRVRCVAWDPVGVYERLLRADIGIIPVETATAPVAPLLPVAAWQAKSENRLTMKMSMGLPVVATPIPSYREVVRHGVNAMLASSLAQWHESLEALRDPDLRREMGARARASVEHAYSMEAQAARLSAVLGGLVAAADRSPSCGSFGHAESA